MPDERSRTDSHISLMTGIYHKELRRQRSSDAEADPGRPARRVNLGVYLYSEDEATDAPKA